MLGSCGSFHAAQLGGNLDCDKYSHDASTVAFGGRFVRNTGIETVFDRCESTCATPDVALKSKRMHKAHSDNTFHLHAFSSEFCSCSDLEIRFRSVYT